MDADTTTLAEAWDRLPDAGLPGLDARWLGTTSPGDLDALIQRLSVEAYGHIPFSRWLDPIQRAPSMWTREGELDAEWVEAIREASRRLTRAQSGGCRVGPEWWSSWLLWELPDSHRHLAERFRTGAKPVF